MPDKTSLYFYQAVPPIEVSGVPTIAGPWPVPTEQLTTDLHTYYASVASVRRAYFVRLPPPWPEVGLCLAADGDQDAEIINRSTFIWNWHLGRSAPLLLLFLTQQLERTVESVSRPFYAAA